jgi:hypothetical protein
MWYNVNNLQNKVVIYNKRCWTMIYEHISMWFEVLIIFHMKHEILGTFKNEYVFNIGKVLEQWTIYLTTNCIKLFFQISLYENYSIKFIQSFY